MRQMPLPQRVPVPLIARCWLVLCAVNPIEFVVSGIDHHQVRFERQRVFDNPGNSETGDRRYAQVEDLYRPFGQGVLQHRLEEGRGCQAARMGKTLHS